VNGEPRLLLHFVYIMTLLKEGADAVVAVDRGYNTGALNLLR
jgi:hypothetical protein